MTKEQLSEHYASQKVLANPRNAFIGYSWDTQKKLTTFDGYDIEQAYEDGFDKAVELACRFFYERNYSSEFIKNFKEIMEEGV